MHTSLTDIRRAFLDFFEEKAHTVVPSDSLVPSSDPTLLFTSAGMVPFKAHFQQTVPLTFRRAASSQRCLRTTDIEQVGLTPRHLTFFEMLGNFSFGDYFKEEAIAWAWAFLTKTLGLSEAHLYPTVFSDDDESFALWTKFVPSSKIRRLGEETNFWAMGPTGPCGPCSEIYFDLETRGEGGAGPDDSNRWMEVWNLVFTQFDRQTDGALKPLPNKNIDTGMGLERLTSVLEGVPSNFDTSLMRPLMAFAMDTLGARMGADPRKTLALRIVADHLRAVAFLVHDGVLPSNEGRGYVLRRLLRRALRQGALFGKMEPFLYHGVSVVAEAMGDAGVELSARSGEIAGLIRQEEERFLETLGTGSEKLSVMARDAKAAGLATIPGADVFRLYDTYGFPPELTREMLLEDGLAFDDAGFTRAKEDAQALAREGWKGSGAEDTAVYLAAQKVVGTVAFIGYDRLEARVPVAALLVNGALADALPAGGEGLLIARETPFYPEGGGQVGDRGVLRDADGAVLAEVRGTRQPVPGLIVHEVTARKAIKTGATLTFAVDPAHRDPTRRHHTATHLLHAALRAVLGTSITQAGSLVSPERLRFDYAFSRAPTAEELRAVEAWVNHATLANLKAEPRVLPIAQAKALGAMALFGEKYGSEVRCLVIGVDGFDTDPSAATSIELCGGTHCASTGEIGAFKIVTEASIAAGVRRIEAVAGEKALAHLSGYEATVKDLAAKLKAPPAELAPRIQKLVDRVGELEAALKEAKLRLAQGPGGAGGAAGEDALETQNVNGITLAVRVAEGLDADTLRTLADRIRQKIGSGVVFAASVLAEDGREKISFVVAATPDMKEKKVNAGALAKKIAEALGGSGGGRPDFAQGGGEGRARLTAFLPSLPSLLL